MPRRRPRKPDEIKLADGTWRKDRDGEPGLTVATDGAPVPPPHLKGEALKFLESFFGKRNPPQGAADGPSLCCSP